ncbi:MAG: hypothetical protein Hals2KO_16560 [Halioglobus sp.]
MSDKTTGPGEHDEQLTRMFRDMREQDARLAPKFREQLAAVDNPPANEDALRRTNARAPLQWAGALAALALVAIVVMPRSESPDDLYLQIMSANSVITEEMVVASPGTLPEQHLYPDLFGEAEPVDFAEYLN